MILALAALALAPATSGPAPYPAIAPGRSDCTPSNGRKVETCDRPATCGDALCRARAAEQDRDYASSASEFEAVAAAAPAGSPTAARALAAAGNMWIAANQPGKAAMALDRALAGRGLEADDRGEALLDRARAAESQGDLKTARAKVQLAVESIAADPFLWYFSAALAVRENNLPEAKIAIARALKLAPTSPEILFEAGHVAAAADEPAAARDYWQRSLAAEPNGPTAGAARAALAAAEVPLTVTGKVAARPDGDGEGGDGPN